MATIPMDQIYSSLLQEDREWFKKEFDPEQEELFALLKDRSLVEGVPETVERQSALTRGIGQRARSRYGITETPIEQQERERLEQLGSATGLAGGLTNARLQQRENNRRLLTGLIDYGNKFKQTAVSELGSVAQQEIAGRAAYNQARAQHKYNKWGILGRLVSAI